MNEPITKEQLAALLNGREYGNEITEDEEARAKAAGLIVIFGYSDDNIELRGVINDEQGCYGGGEFKIDRKGLLPEREQIDDGDDDELKDFFKREPKAAKVEAIWNKCGYSWTYKTILPHATLEITDDGKKYCRGIVITASDLPSLE